MTARPGPERIILPQLHILRLMLSQWSKTDETRRKADAPFMTNIRYNWLNTYPYEHGEWHFLKTRCHFLRSKFSPQHTLWETIGWGISQKKSLFAIIKGGIFFSRMFKLPQISNSITKSRLYATVWWFSSAWERMGVQLWAIPVGICEQSTRPTALWLQTTQKPESLQLMMCLDLTAITKQIH